MEENASFIGSALTNLFEVVRAAQEYSDAWEAKAKHWQDSKCPEAGSPDCKECLAVNTAVVAADWKVRFHVSALRGAGQ